MKITHPTPTLDTTRNLTHRKKGGIVFALAILINFLAPQAIAQKQNLLQPLNSSININDGQTGQPIGQAGYNITQVYSFWGLNQWLNPVNLVPQIFPPNLPWELANSNSRLKFWPVKEGRANVYEIAINNLPCDNLVENTVLEVDMFIEPKNYFLSSPLGEMAQLNLKLSTSGTYSEVSSGCTVNQFRHVASLIMHSTTNQWLTVQINLGGSIPTNGMEWCPNNDSTNPIFCLDDSVTNHGGQFIGQIGHQEYNLDLLPRLIQIIQSNYRKPTNIYLESDPNKWRIVGFYMGTVGHGKINVTSTWSDIKFESTNGTFCNDSKKTQFICETPISHNNWVNVGGGCFHRPTNIICQ